MELFLLCWLGAAVLIGMWADGRGRSWAGFALISLVFSPLLAGIILLVTKDLKAEAFKEEERRAEQEQKDRERREEHEKQLAALSAIAGNKAAPSPSAHGSVAEEIAKLGELLDRGLLTEEEFKSQKAAVLARA